MKKTTITTLAVAIFCVVIWSCNRTAVTYVPRIPQLPQSAYNYIDTQVITTQGNPWGNGFVPDNTPSNNPITNAGATLGRVLFYDKLLSLDNNVSCGSCHKQQFAFADNTAFSTGFMGGKTKRNSMPVVNQKMNFSFFWDSRASTLEQQSTMPVQNHIEMGMENLNNIAPKLIKAGYYTSLFKDAFGSSDINADRIAAALAQFMRSITSSHSKFDAGTANSFINFTQTEKDGMKFFTSFRCGSCHSGQNFNNNGQGWANIGLDVTDKDLGIGGTNGSSFQNGAFRIPSLRNIALTAPYMHDGRYATLSDVLLHYNNIQPNANLDFLLRTDAWGSKTVTPVQFNMTDYQKSAIIAFLNTLTDEQLIHDPRFSDPFK